MPIIRSLHTGLLTGCLSATLLLVAAPPVYADVAPSPALLLAKVASGDIDPAPYWVSEKLDGVRALWDGKQLHFRSGNPVHAPAWFIAGLPPQALDGELWIARNRFEQVSGIVRRQQPVDADWRQVRYMIFELPDAPGPFTARIAQMRAIVSAANVPWLHAVEQFRVSSHAALMRQMNDVVQGGGEGLMLHLADAPYLTGRQDVLLKLKPWQDTEATVVGYTPGTGKYRGLTGALEVQMPDGKRFLIGSGLPDAVRRNPPAIGSLITYRYQALTQDGVPRFARYLRVRVND
ncbi:MAG: DNA ligase [Pseudomonadota bacterium]